PPPPARPTATPVTLSVHRLQRKAAKVSRTLRRLLAPNVMRGAATRLATEDATVVVTATAAGTVAPAVAQSRVAAQSRVVAPSALKTSRRGKRVGSSHRTTTTTPMTAVTRAGR